MSRIYGKCLHIAVAVAIVAVNYIDTPKCADFRKSATARCEIRPFSFCYWCLGLMRITNYEQPKDDAG